MSMTKRRTRSEPIPGDVLSSVQDLGISLDRITRDEAWALCPGHKANTGRVDRKASWSVNLITGDSHCFSCGWGGSFVNLVRWMEGTDTEKAREWVRKHGGFEAAKKRLRGETGYEAEEAEPVTEADLALFVDPPIKELEKRRISLAACKRFGVLWDSKKDCWILPVRGPYTGALRGWQEKGTGRAFNNYPKNLGMHDTLFGFSEHHDGMNVNTAILQESPLDAVLLDDLGLHAGASLSSYGVNVSDAQMRLIIDRFDTLILALDNDKSGYAESDRLRKKYLGRIAMKFFAYQGTEKDFGEMNGADISWGISHATTAMVTRF